MKNITLSFDQTIVNCVLISHVVSEWVTHFKVTKCQIIIVNCTDDLQKMKSDTKVWLDSIWGYWDPIEDLTISYNIPLDILHYLTIPNRKGYLTYRTDNLAQTAKPTLGREVGQQYYHLFW